MYRNTFLSVMFLACCFNGSLCAQSDAQIYERTCDAKTYPFSDPCKRRRSSGKWLFWKMIM